MYVIVIKLLHTSTINSCSPQDDTFSLTSHCKVHETNHTVLSYERSSLTVSALNINEQLMHTVHLTPKAGTMIHPLGHRALIIFDRAGLILADNTTYLIHLILL